MLKMMQLKIHNFQKRILIHINNCDYCYIFIISDEQYLILILFLTFVESQKERKRFFVSYEIILLGIIDRY